MKKKFLILCSLLALIVAYMLIVWFCVPTRSYTDLFATEQIMRIVASRSPLFLIGKVFFTQLVVAFLFFSLSLLLYKKLKRNMVFVLSTALPSVCSFVLNVFLIKPRIIGIGVDSYDAHTIIGLTVADLFNVTLFDALFALTIGIITSLLVILAVRWYRIFAPELVGDAQR